MRSQYGIKEYGIKQFVLQRTGTYNDQYRRPYNTVLDHSTQQQLVDTITNTPGLTASHLAEASNQFMQPSATPESMIVIPNGWGTERIRFLLAITTTDHMGNVNNEHVVGYTDYSGVSNNLNIDPDMIFHINAISITQTTMVRTPMGNQYSNRLIDTSHILSDTNYSNAFNPNQMFNLAPENVFNRMNVLDMTAGLNEYDSDSFLVDTTGILNQTAVKSKRSNNIIPVYAATMFNSYTNALQNHQYDVNSARSEASGLARSDPARNDTFMNWLQKNGSMQRNNMFRYRDLENFCNNVRNVTIVVPTDVYNDTRHRVGSTSDWHGSDINTVFATSISQSVPSYMLDYSINKIRLFSTNMDFTGRINTTFSDVKSFSDGPDMPHRLEAFKAKLESELIRGLTYNGQISYQLELTVDLLGETFIRLSVNGSAFIDYVCPSFADGLMSPVVTNNKNVLDTLVNDFDMIFDGIGAITSTVHGNNGMSLSGI